MWTVRNNSMKVGEILIAAALTLTLLAMPVSSSADTKKNKKNTATQPAASAAAKPQVDYSKLVWPGPPNVPRIHYVNYMAGQKFDYTPADQQPKPKHTWMDRLAGTQPEKDKKLKQMPFQLLGPYGMAEKLVLTLQPGASVGVQGISMDAVVPEPKTWAMLIIGFGLMAALGYKRARSPRFVSL